jgi:hypothetical protein
MQERIPDWLVSLRLDIADLRSTSLANRRATQERIELLQDSVRRDIAWVMTHVEQRFAEVLRHQDRLERDLRHSGSDTEAAKNLMAISRVAAMLRRVPWRVIILVVAGFLATVAHLLPAEINQVLRDYHVLTKRF